MMHNRFRKILASLALLLGVAHIIFGVVVFKAFNLEVFWFLSFGLAMIVTALANFTHIKTRILCAQNALSLSFICALAFLAPQPQVLLGCILFTGLFVLSCFKNMKSDGPTWSVDA